MSRKQPKKIGLLKRILRDHFIPHSGNKHIPHVLHHRALFGYSVILVLLKVLVLTVSISFPAASLFSSAITPTNIISLTNETRRNLNLPELSTDPKLMQAAQAKAEDMFLNGYFAHTSPTGVTPWYWFQTFGYDYRSAGENLAAHFTQAEDVEAGWMASPTHRDNIVSDRYDEIGVGVAQGIFEDYQTTFVVQMFGYELNQDVAVTEVVEPPITEPVEPTVAEPAPVEPEPVSTPSTSEALVVASEQASNPATAPAEVVAPAEAESDPEALFIDTSSLVLTPIESGYAAEINMKNVNEAVLYMGSNRVPFVSTDTPDVWQSVILYNSATMSADGERLYMVAGDVDGGQQIVDLAWIMPGTDAPEVYAFKGADAPKLLGVMDVSNLDDNVQKFYIFTLLFLGAALLIAVFVKIEVQKPTMIAHSLAVIALALLLSVI
jgi:hypothetical protein